MDVFDLSEIAVIHVLERVVRGYFLLAIDTVTAPQGHPMIAQRFIAENDS